jgi:hypothetical protein
MSTSKKQQSTKVLANKQFKENTFSLSGLVRYAKADGRKLLEQVINEYNEKHETKVTFGQVANVKNIVKHATEKELTKKDGTKKELFSYWLVLQTVGRIGRASK